MANDKSLDRESPSGFNTLAAAFSRLNLEKPALEDSGVDVAPSAVTGLQGDTLRNVQTVLSDGDGDDQYGYNDTDDAYTAHFYRDGDDEDEDEDEDEYTLSPREVRLDDLMGARGHISDDRRFVREGRRGGNLGKKRKPIRVRKSEI